MEFTEREFLAQKQTESYAAYMKTFSEIALNKLLSPVFLIKDNFLLYVKVFLAALMFMILMQYIGDIYTEWLLGTQAGLAAFLIMKIWFSYKLFSWFYPSGIVKQIKDAAKHFEEVQATKKWTKEASVSASGLSNPLVPR
jgi:hypothetical protein